MSLSDAMIMTTAGVSPPTRRGWAIQACLVVMVALAWSVELALKGGGRGVSRDVSNVGLFVAALGAGRVMIGKAKREHGRSRWSWSMLAASAVSWGVGQALWTLYESVLNRQPFPSLADIGYLGAIPTAFAGLLLLPNFRNSWQSRTRYLADAALLAGALFMVSWVVVLKDLFHTPSDSTLAQVISLAYPIGDLISATLAIFVLVHALRFRDLALGSVLLITFGIVSLAVADTGFAFLNVHGTYYSGHLDDVGWFVGYCLLGLAATWPSEDRPDVERAIPERNTRTTILLPYTAVIVAAGVGLQQVLTVGRLTAVHGVSLIAVLLLVSARQVITLLENFRLTTDLESRVVSRTHELTSSESRFRALVTHSSDVVFVVDERLIVTYVSPAVTEVYGYSPQDLIGRPFFRFMRLGDSALVLDEMRDALASPMSSRRLSFTIRGADGRWRDTETTVTSLVEDPAVNGLVFNSRDITERRELEDQLVHQAFHDTLTQLANRALFADRVGQALVGAARRGSSLAVLFLDLDGFKAVNDSLGHAAGDRLLVAVANRLRDTARAGDTVARLGGDEFAVLLEEISSPADASDVAERLISALREPVHFDGREFAVRCSIGIAQASGSVMLPSADELLRNADLAMYQAKKDRTGGFAWFEASMHEAVVTRVEQEADLALALERRQLALHYQPTVELATGEIVGVEALMRWNHPSGVVMPNDFIPLAEETGHIVAMGAWALEEACRQAVAWDAESTSAEELTVAVNVSGRQLLTGDFADTVSYALHSSGLPPERLVLELTESVLVDGGDKVITTLKSIRKAGVRIAIDDFGTGFSSLSYLSRFPVDILKVDRSFVGQLGDENGDRPDQVLARTIVELGRSLQLTTVAEGIEAAEQMDDLRQMGCDHGQGFLFAKPLPPGEILALLRRNLGRVGAVSQVPWQGGPRVPVWVSEPTG